MKIIFVKEYTDKESFDNWVTIQKGEIGELIDEVTGRVEMSEGFDRVTTLMHVPSSCYRILDESDL